ncbi:MAG TPA: 1-acyl-sn-glycerol-3-phosphate acyltransferase [Spirochaetes bacterium]|nr:1-acyl-sn-glycerol-3-phosphate acyltransferase [Spirochaetota bacterium]
MKIDYGPKDLFVSPKLYFNWIVLRFVQPFYIRFFKLSAVGLENVPKVGSYVVVANHSHLLDPFFIGALIRKTVFQMASNEFFRKPLIKRFMWAMCAFPRKKGFIDIKSIKYAISLARKGYPLVIYPEGGRNWDGETLPILKSTAKLIKILKVPLITVVSKGNYLAFPRWANERRKSPITIHYSKPVMFGKESSDEVIIEHIRKGIYNNDNYTEIKKIKGKNPADGLPRLLWRCPECRNIDALVEKKGKHVMCTFCKKEWEVNLACNMREQGTEDWRAIKEYADTMFKEEEIVPLADEKPEGLESDEIIYLKSKTVTLYHEPFYPELEKIGNGTLYLAGKRLLFIKADDNSAFSYPFEEIRGRSTEVNTVFQIILDNDIARFEMMQESCYKWEIIYNHIRMKGGYMTTEE